MLGKPQPWSPGVERSLPLTFGLRAAFPFWEGAGMSVQDQIQGRINSTFHTHPNWVGTAGGFGMDFNGSSDWLDYGDVLDLGTSDFTVAVFLSCNSDFTETTGSGRVIQKRGTGSAGSVSGWQLCARRSTNDMLLRNTLIDDGSAAISFTDDLDLGFDITEPFLYSLARVNTINGEVRVNGRLIESSTNASVTGSVNNSRFLTFAASDTNEVQFASIIVQAGYIWDRALSEVTLVELAADPFLPFRIDSAYDTAIFSAGVSAADVGHDWLSAAIIDRHIADIVRR